MVDVGEEREGYRFLSGEQANMILGVMDQIEGRQVHPQFDKYWLAWQELRLFLAEQQDQEGEQGQGQEEGREQEEDADVNVDLSLPELPEEDSYVTEEPEQEAAVLAEEELPEEVEVEEEEAPLAPPQFRRVGFMPKNAVEALKASRIAKENSRIAKEPPKMKGSDLPLPPRVMPMRSSGVVSSPPNKEGAKKPEPFRLNPAPVSPKLVQRQSEPLAGIAARVSADPSVRSAVGVANRLASQNAPASAVLPRGRPDLRAREREALEQVDEDSLLSEEDE